MRNQLILIEGLDATGKSTLVTNLSGVIDAVVIRNPPDILDERISKNDLRIFFDEVGGARRREFYRSANFISSEMARIAMNQSWVIMDRYWPSTAAFATMDTFEKGWEPLGVYPKGFLKPDMMFLLTVSEDERKARLSKRNVPETDEESRLFINHQQRDLIQLGYRAFNPIEIDTSNLSELEVLRIVLQGIEAHSNTAIDYMEW